MPTLPYLLTELKLIEIERKRQYRQRKNALKTKFLLLLWMVTFTIMRVFLIIFGGVAWVCKMLVMKWVGR